VKKKPKKMLREAEEFCESLFFPCSNRIIGNLILMAIYGFILSKGSGWIADGSEHLIDVLPGPLVGGLILPILGSVPDCAIILVSCLGGTPEEIAAQVGVGVGTLAGSTIMLLTLPVFGTIFLARCDIGPNKEAVDGQCGKHGCGSLVKTGVTVTKDVPLTALILMLSSVSYFVIQIAAFVYMGSPDIGEKEHYFALAGAIICFISLTIYAIFMIFFPKYPKRILNAIRSKRHVMDVIERFRMPLLFQAPNAEKAEPAPEREPLLGSTNRTVDEESSLLPPPEQSQEEGDTAATTGSAAAPAIASHRVHHIGLKWKTKAKDQKTRRDFGVGEAGGHGSEAKKDDDDDDEEEKPEVLTGKQKCKIWMKALFWMGLGTATVAIFSDPMVDSISTLSALIDTSGQLQFYISFIITPLASNASELISALIFAKKKKRKITSVSFSALLGAATMNNTLCLGIFLLMIFMKNITWDFSAESFAIVLTEVFVAILCFWRTHRFWKSLVFAGLYPLALGIVFFLENVLHWH